jgi:hypothetical protein
MKDGADLRDHQGTPNEILQNTDNGNMKMDAPAFKCLRDTVVDVCMDAPRMKHPRLVIV